jgi:hypothetical protein
VTWVLGIDTPGGVGAWHDKGVLFCTSKKDVANTLVLVDHMVKEYGAPMLAIVERPHGVDTSTMFKQQAVLKNAISAGYLQASLQGVADEVWLMTAPEWRQPLGISGGRDRVKALARRLAERAYDVCGAGLPKSTLSEHSAEGLCMAMSGWLRLGADSREDPLIQMLGLHALRKEIER